MTKQKQFDSFNSMSFLKNINKERNQRVSQIDKDFTLPAIRAHLIELFKKAHAKDDRLTGVYVGMGTAIGVGEYACFYEEENEIVYQKAFDFKYRGPLPMYKETIDFLQAVSDYSDLAVDYSNYIKDITLDDIK